MTDRDLLWSDPDGPSFCILSLSCFVLKNVCETNRSIHRFRRLWYQVSIWQRYSKTFAHHNAVGLNKQIEQSREIIPG
jgi:hypothetical protein